MRLLRIATAALTLSLPFFAFAEETWVWDFRGTTMPQEWRTQSLSSVVPREEGLLVSTQSMGTLTRDVTGMRGIDAIRITYSAPADVQMGVVYANEKTAAGKLKQVVFALGATDGLEEVSIDMASLGAWDRRPNTMGFAFAPNSTILLSEVTVISYTAGERMASAWKTFWHFDSLRPYSINFLWGPLLTFTPVGNERLYMSIPPRGISFFRPFTWVLGITFIACAILWFLRRSPEHRRALLVYGACAFAASWVVLDVRMGSEIISYFVKDYRTYISAEEGTATLRDRGQFYDFAEQAAPFVKDRKNYIFFTPDRYPYLGLIRYYTYPSLPTVADAFTRGVDTWLIYARPDVTVNDAGQLVNEGQIISPAGKVLLNMGNGTFVFRSL